MCIIITISERAYTRTFPVFTSWGNFVESLRVSCLFVNNVCIQCSFWNLFYIHRGNFRKHLHFCVWEIFLMYLKLFFCFTEWRGRMECDVIEQWLKDSIMRVFNVPFEISFIFWKWHILVLVILEYLNRKIFRTLFIL